MCGADTEYVCLYNVHKAHVFACVMHVSFILQEKKEQIQKKKTRIDFGYNSAMEILEVSSMHGGG